jgi:hypothetical protein
MKYYIANDDGQTECQLSQSKGRYLELIFQKFSHKLKYKKRTYFHIIKIIFIIFYSFLSYLPNNVLNSKTSNHVFYNDIDCIIVKNKLKKRIHPFDFVNEFHFFTDLISCKIPFSFIRFGDGENLIMKGAKINVLIDKWHWNPKNKKFQESLIESSSICINHNNFIGIPCKDWIKVSKSILSFSKCSSAKYMSYATLFINKNYAFFKDWILHFINTSFPNRWKIILIANSIINKSIEWAYKFFPVPDHLIDNWDNYSISLLQKLSHLAKQNNLIFFISAGPAANVIISYLIKINNNNIYIDFGSSIEFITKGYTTRPYAINTTRYSKHSCQPFFLQNKTLIYI